MTSFGVCFKTYRKLTLTGMISFIKMDNTLIQCIWSKKARLSYMLIMTFHLLYLETVQISEKWTSFAIKRETGPLSPLASAYYTRSVGKPSSQSSLTTLSPRIVSFNNQLIRMKSSLIKEGKLSKLLYTPTKRISWNKLRKGSKKLKII